MIVWIFSGYTFADGTGDTNVDDFVNILYKILSFLSWWWVILANLAWKMMTNDVVYGGFLHLDSTLWTLWNVVKNFANFLLWFLVLYSVLRNLLSPVWFAPKKKPLDIIKNTLIAGILIQMSRFLVWVVLDISTVCTAAIWSFPAQFLVASDEFKGSFSKNLDDLVKNKVIVNYSDTDEPIKLQPIENEDFDEDDMNSLIDTLLPSTDSLSWPLIYIWMLVFNFSDYNIQQVEDGGSWKELFLSVWIDGALLLAYSVMMLLIFIFNLMRVLILWIAIPMMPLIIVASLFDFKWGQSFLSEIINIKNLLKLAFKPVVLVWALSLVLIVLVLVRWIITKNDNKVDLSDKNLVIYSQNQWDDTYNSTMDIDGLLNVKMNWFKEWFADIIVYILWLCLIYFVMKLSTVKTGIKFIDDTMDGIFNRVKELATNAPIIPIPWWRPVSVNTIQEQLSRDDILSRSLGIDESDQDTKIRSWLGVGETSYDVLNAKSSREDFMKQAYEISVANWIYTYDQLNSQKNIRHYKALNKKIEERSRQRNKPPIDMKDIFDHGKTKTSEQSSSQGSDKKSS